MFADALSAIRASILSCCRESLGWRKIATSYIYEVSHPEREAGRMTRSQPDLISYRRGVSARRWHTHVAVRLDSMMPVVDKRVDQEDQPK
jgi:hypothetical protein